MGSVRHIDSAASVRRTRPRAGRPRSLVLVDGENMMGGWVTRRGVKSMVWQLIPWVGPDDPVVSGWSPRSLAVGGFCVPAGWSTRCGPAGPDSADKALLAAADGFRWGPSCGLTVVSGDHAFVGLAEQASRAGALVTVITGLGGRSRALASQAHRLIALNPWGPVLPGAVLGGAA